MRGKGGFKLMPQAATTCRSVVLYFFGQGNLIFIREKSGKSDVCGNYVKALLRRMVSTHQGFIQTLIVFYIYVGYHMKTVH